MSACISRVICEIYSLGTIDGSAVMLSFELKNADGKTVDELEIFMDRDGLESLLAQLKFLREGKTEHVHLMAESWGGSHLSQRPQGHANVSIRHVKIMLTGG
jgi:hypothetical protein